MRFPAGKIGQAYPKVDVVTTQTSAHLSCLQFPAQLSHRTLPIPSPDAETLIVQLLIPLDTTTNLPHIAIAITLMMMMS